jgi:hypothetical protein
MSNLYHVKIKLLVNINSDLIYVILIYVILTSTSNIATATSSYFIPFLECLLRALLYLRHVSTESYILIWIQII